MGNSFPRQYEILFQKAKSDIAIACQALDSHNTEIDPEKYRLKIEALKLHVEHIVGAMN